jgi:hypothetical protein
VQSLTPGHVCAGRTSREEGRAADRRPSIYCLVGSGGRERRAPNAESCRRPKRVGQTEHSGHGGRVSRVAAGEDESIGLSLQQRGQGSTGCNVGGGARGEAARTLGEGLSRARGAVFVGAEDRRRCVWLRKEGGRRRWWKALGGRVGVE